MAGIPVVVVASGGLPVTEAVNGFGVPVSVVTEYGLPVTVATNGLPVTGLDTGSSVGPAYRMIARTGSFVLSGESMEIVSGYVMSAGVGEFALAGQSATLTPPVSTPPLVSYIGFAAFPSGSATELRTFSAVNIGTASATRRVICVFVGATVGRTVNNALSSINGVAFQHSVLMGENGDQGAMHIASAIVPSGTSGDIKIYYPEVDFGLFRVYVFTVDNSLLTSHIPVVASTQNMTSVTTATTSVATLAGGFLIGSLRASFASGASITGGTSGIAVDNSDNGGWLGHVNGTTATTVNATVSWTTVSSYVWGLAAFR